MKIIKGKFREMEGEWISCEVREYFVMSLLKDIKKGWKDFSHIIVI